MREVLIEVVMSKGAVAWKGPRGAKVLLGRKRGGCSASAGL